MIDITDDGATTDIGQSSASETESSSGLSSSEGHRTLARRCRFGNTSLETIPATPSAATMPLNSPPGFSRAAMREARDAYKQGTSSSESVSDIEKSTSSSGVTLSRFGETPFGTVPKTPSGKAKWKSLKNVFGSPPGLSLTEKRRARDACKAPTLAPASWGGKDALSAGALSGKSTARSKLANAKEEAALLKDLKRQQFVASAVEASVQDSSSSGEAELEQNMGLGHEHLDEAMMGDTSEAEAAAEESIAEGQNCRFNCTALGTMPSTPLRKELAPSSPPGLSRKAMRQSRDSLRASATTLTSWGARRGEALTISPASKPMTAPVDPAARQRATRDAMALGLAGLVTSTHQASGPR